METFDAISARRNVRTFTDEPVEQAQLDKILDAGRRAPSARNTQPWDFVLSTDRSQLEKLAEAWRGAGHVAGSAATIVLVVNEPQDEAQRALIHYDLGQATMAMELEATDLGLGTAHASIGDKPLVAEILGIPEGHYAAYFLAIGHPLSGPPKPLKKLDRRAFDEVVHVGRW